jgi:hypothetical protein
MKKESSVAMYFNSVPMADVVVRTEPAPWWQVLAAVGPYVIIFLCEILAIVLLVRGTRRAKTASRIDWEQLAWALDASVSEDTQRAKMGRRVLGALSQVQLSDVDRELLRAATTSTSGLMETELHEPPLASSPKRHPG